MKSLWFTPTLQFLYKKTFFHDFVGQMILQFQSSENIWQIVDYPNWNSDNQSCHISFIGTSYLKRKATKIDIFTCVLFYWYCVFITCLYFIKEDRNRTEKNDRCSKSHMLNIFPYLCFCNLKIHSVQETTE